MLNTMQFPIMFGQNNNSPYMDNNFSSSEQIPRPMSGDMTEDNLYPMESQYSNNSTPTNFANGGRVSKKKNNIFPSLAEMIRQQGKGEDTILAHINPLEAMMLKQMGGKGTINKKTGLPQFGFLNKPGKALKSIGGGGIGAILGNMIMPGVGGIVGGAIGQGAQHAFRGKSFGEGALKGGMMGAALPTGAGLLGGGLGSLGATGSGNFLTNYGATNAILPSLGMGDAFSGLSSGGSAPINSSPLGGILSSSGKGMGGLGSMSNIGGMSGKETNNSQTSKEEAPQSFTDMLMGNSKNFFSKPKNLLTLASLGGKMLDKPKEKTPEKYAEEHKRFLRASMLTPAERAAMEADLLAQRQMERRIARNQYLPEELFEAKPVYTRTNTPEEFKKTGNWLRYYNNPSFAGSPLMMKKGGQVPSMVMETKEIITTPYEGKFLKGPTKGQHDQIDAALSDGEFVIPADVVAHLGDGNSMAGGKEFYKLIKNVRKSKGMPNKLPPKAKSILEYMR
jgi:hypothetical protein